MSASSTRKAPRKCRKYRQIQISTQDRTHANKQRNEHTNADTKAHKKAHTSARPTSSIVERGTATRPCKLKISTSDRTHARTELACLVFNNG